MANIYAYDYSSHGHTLRDWKKIADFYQYMFDDIMPEDNERTNDYCNEDTGNLEPGQPSVYYQGFYKDTDSSNSIGFEHLLLQLAPRDVVLCYSLATLGNNSSQIISRIHDLKNKQCLFYTHNGRYYSFYEKMETGTTAYTEMKLLEQLYKIDHKSPKKKGRPKLKQSELNAQIISHYMSSLQTGIPLNISALAEQCHTTRATVYRHIETFDPSFNTTKRLRPSRRTKNSIEKEINIPEFLLLSPNTSFTLGDYIYKHLKTENNTSNE